MPSRWIIKECDDPIRGIKKGWGIYTESGALVVPEIVGATLAEHDARARLIAAAPELFAALITCMEHLPPSVHVLADSNITEEVRNRPDFAAYYKARNAINKAKGE